MRLLFVHQNFPAQFVHLAKQFASDPAHEIVALTDARNTRADLVRTVRYPAPRLPDPAPFGVTRRFVEHVQRAEIVAAAAQTLKREGFSPDLIIGHFGWGETLFLKEVWPRAKLIVYGEFYYGGQGSDTDFDPEFSIDHPRVRQENVVRNASLLSALSTADRAIAPTEWQRSRFPVQLQSKIEVIHDGIDTDKAAPDPVAQVTLKRDGLVLGRGDEVVTFVSRNLEPYRGYHTFMWALPRILAERPRARALIIGGDGVSYGSAAPHASSWRDVFLREVRDTLDLSRVHYVGCVPHALFLNAMQLSSVHVYLTYPFVLSWSLLEAMACGGLIVGSDTDPVREVIRHDANGVLTDFFNADDLARRVIDALAAPDRYQPLREAARRTIVEAYDLRSICLPRGTKLLTRLAYD